jgi:signal peptidase II
MIKFIQQYAGGALILSKKQVKFKMKKQYYLMGCPALAIVFLDQLSKWIVANKFALYDTIPVIKGFFNLVYVRNRGMAFGFLNTENSDLGVYLLIAASIIFVFLLIVWGAKLKEDETLTLIGFSFLLGGASGNLIDRIRLQGVIDFLDFYFGPYHWPSFNIADSAITVGAFWIALTLLFKKEAKKQ